MYQGRISIQEIRYVSRGQVPSVMNTLGDRTHFFLFVYRAPKEDSHFQTQLANTLNHSICHKLQYKLDQVFNHRHLFGNFTIGEITFFAFTKLVSWGFKCHYKYISFTLTSIKGIIPTSALTRPSVTRKIFLWHIDDQSCCRG